MAANTQVFFLDTMECIQVSFSVLEMEKTFYDKIKQQSMDKAYMQICHLLLFVCFCLDDEDVPAVVLYMITNVVIFGWFQWH